jgi:3',5'-cyclic AMP phosphodiesterase CpdA
MKIKLLLPILVMLVLASCSDHSSGPSVQTIKIAVLSDVHYMDPSLLQNGAENGEAFLNYLNADPKLVQYSDAIFKAALAKVKAESPSILLIAGDLTKDGEVASHMAVARLLKEFSGSSIKIYVVPGNHDIQNPEARSYNGDIASPTPSISPADFASIYAEFGYRNAIAKDPNSLSYVSQPYSDLWILGIDGCKYYENVAGIAVVSGVIKPETMQWIKDMMALAKQMLDKISLIRVM